MNEQQRAVVQQALEAHQALREWILSVPSETVLPAMPGINGDWLDGVEAALRQLLEQPEQSAERGEPVAWMDASGDIYKHELWPDWNPPHKPLYTAPQEQPAPVQDLSRLEPFVHGLGKAILRELMDAPPAQPAAWVGLTNYEIGLCSTEAAMNRSEMVGGAVTFARAIEAKLKEKNT